VIEDVLKGGSSCLKYWWWEKSSLCFVIVLSKDWVTIAVSDHVRFSREMTLAVCKNRKNRACFICDQIEYNLQKLEAQTMNNIWSSSVLANIFIIDGVAESVLLWTQSWHCFQTNKMLPKSEHLVLVAVYLKILNVCKIIVVKTAFRCKSNSGTILYDI